VADRKELREWLEYASADLDARWRELQPALRRLAEDHPAINDGDEDTAEIFTENLRMASALRDAIEDFHKKEKAPYWSNGKLVDAWFNTFAGLLDGLTGPLRAALRDFAIRRDRARMFEDKEPVRGTYGATAIVKETWGYEVDDIAKVPIEYHMVDDRMVKAIMADRDPKTRKPRQTIPGIRWVKRQQLAVS
jgi:hypothetical protein